MDIKELEKNKLLEEQDDEQIAQENLSNILVDLEMVEEDTVEEDEEE